MASNTYNMNTWGAKRIFGDAHANLITDALLQITANNTWILSSGRQSTYGIKYVYDSSTDHDKIELYGGQQVSNADVPTVWVQLDTGDVYILGQVGINHAPDTYQLYVDGTSYFDDDITVEGNVVPNQTNTYTLGTSSLRWSKLYIGTADSYGSTTQPIYWNAGVPNILGTIGGQYEPVWVDDGTITAITAGTTGQFYRGDKSWSNTLESQLLLPYGLKTGSRVNDSGSGIEVGTDGGIEIFHSSTPFIDFHYGASTADYTSRIIESASGSLKIIGKLGVGMDPSEKLSVDGWVGTSGNTGWYSITHKGGWYMSDTKWIRSYNSKPTILDIGTNNTYGICGHRLALAMVGSSHISWIMKGGSVIYGFCVNGNGNWYFGRRTNDQSLETTTNDAYGYYGDNVSVLPNGDNVKNLGNSSNRWKEVRAVTFYGALSGNATTCSYPYGFASKTDNATWGNTTGTSIVSWNDSTGGSIAFRRDNPSSGKMSVKVDGRFYGNEGTYPAMLMRSENGYWGICDPDAANNVWIRTTTLGIIPYQSGASTAGHCEIGTSTWYFSASYITKVNTTWLRVIHNSSNNGDDAVVYIENKSSSDWGLKINCDGYNYGINVVCASTAANGISVTGRITGTTVYNAVWNDYAECRQVETEEPGFCVTETKSGKMIKTTTRLQAGCKITSDTFGTCMGETDIAKTPIAVAGRVLVYPYQNREEYQLGAAVCSAPNGTVDIMTREEIITYPERIIGTVSEIPNYEIWRGGEQDGQNDIKVNGRIWIYVR